MHISSLSRLFHVLLLCFVVGIAGCDSNDGEDGDDDDNGGDNTASIEVSGALDEEYDGFATYASAFGISWAVTIALDDDKGTVILSVVGDADEDTYPIGEDNEEGLVGVNLTLADLADVEGSGSTSVILTSGTVTITDRDNDRVRGRFSGQGQTLGGDLPISASGTFNATCFGILCDIGG